MTQPNNPLHGVKLQEIVETLVRCLGWRRLGELVDVRSFNYDPSVKSSLKFLRRTPWAREQVEALWLEVDAFHRTQRERYNAWLGSGPALASVIDVGERRAGPLDFSQGSALVADPERYATLSGFEALVTEALSSEAIELGYGGYLEDRPFYSSRLFAPGGKAPARTLHLGLDIWGAAGEKVYAPLAGRVHGFRQNKKQLDYGATIVLEHEVEVVQEVGTVRRVHNNATDQVDRPDPTQRRQPPHRKRAQTLRFFTLYGHLSDASLEGLRVGQRVEAGAVLATTGKPHENGGWPPHLHFQVILDTLGHEGDIPGVVHPGEGAWWARICPDPAPFFSAG